MVPQRKLPAGVARRTVQAYSGSPGGLVEVIMVGLVVASHGRLADELVTTAAQIVGKLPAVAT